MTQPAGPAFLAGGGEAGARLRAHDWTRSPLGPPEGWPPLLRHVTSLMLQSPVPMVVLWGEDGLMLYNDGYARIAGGRHPGLIGARVREGWPEAAEFNDQVMRTVLAGQTLSLRDQHFVLHRHGRPETLWLDLDYSPLRDDAGRPVGVLALLRDTTERHLLQARQQFLLRLGDAVRACDDPAQVAAIAVELLGAHLQIDRAGYADVDAAQAQQLRIASEWTAQGMPTRVGELRALDTLGHAAAEALRAGQTLVVNDYRTDPRIVPAHLAAWERIGARAFVVVPLLREGALAALLYAHQGSARNWTQFEVELAQTTAERAADAIGRALAERRLRESEARFGAIANSIDQMIWATRPDGFHDYYNQRWYDYTGVPEGSTNGEAWNGMFHPDDQPRAWARWRHSLATGEPYEIEYRLRHRSGQYRWVLGRAQAMRDARGTIVRWYGTCTDIHDHRVAEDALRRSRDELAAETQALEILNATGANLAGELALDRLVQRVVDAGVELTGAQFGAFFYNDTDPDGDRYMLYALAGAERSAFESLGMPRATAVFGPTFRGEGVIRSDDITADPRYGRNAPHRGMPAGHLPVRSYLAVPVTSRSGEVIGGLFFGHALPAVFSERGERIMVGLAAQAAIAIDNSRLFDAVQQANQALEQRVQARTAELEQAHERLRQSQKMEAVGQLTGGIAHDFNNMLAVVVGSLDLLRRRVGAGDERALRYVEAAADGARRAAVLTQRLLAFSRQQPLRPESLDANRLVAGMSDLLRRSLGSAIELETVLAGGLWRTHADPNQLENAILNLALNARDAMPEGGRLTIETQNAYLDERYVASVLGVPAGQYLMIAVTDTGTGMSEAVIAKAFDPFFTTKEVGKGTGLGLSQVYGFVKQSGGHVKIYSEPGQGTSVKVYLPRHAGSADDAGAEAPEALPVPRGEVQEVVLVVEDEASVRQFSVDALKELGYRVLEADGAEAALRLLQAHPDVALLFTDVVMPQINGARLAEQARRLRPDLRVLFTTGYTRNAVVHNNVLDAGVQLIGKPFTLAELAAKVREVLDRPAIPPAQPSGA